MKKISGQDVSRKGAFLKLFSCTKVPYSKRMCEKTQNFANVIFFFRCFEGRSSTQEKGKQKNNNFYKSMIFSHILYYCMERLNMTFF